MEEESRMEEESIAHQEKNMEEDSIAHQESKMEEDCIAHQERWELEELIQKKLLERQATVVKDEGFVTIIAGSNKKNITLKEVKNKYAASKEWEKVKSDFYCIPNFEKRDFKTKDKERKILEKYKNLLDENTAAKKEEIMQRDKEFKRFEGILTNDTELIIRDLIEECMKGSTGVLFRSVETDRVVSQDKSNMGNLTKLADLGIVIPLYNCRDLQHLETGHSDKCYRSENDFILLYVDGDTLCIRLIEVKRPNTTPWAREEKLPGLDMVKKCLDQLEKGVYFILSMIPDIPTKSLQIKAFSAYPETHCNSIFCASCQARIISAEDVEKTKTQPNILRRKLEIPQDLQQASDSGLDLLLTLASRLVGKASLLHSGYRDLDDAFRHEKGMMKRNLDKIENNFLYLNPLQRDLLLKMNKTSPLKNFCFLGGSGTGKTQMALAVIRKLISTKDDQRPTRIILASCQHEKPEPELLKTFLKEKFKESEHIQVKVYSLGSLMKELGLQGTPFVVMNKDRSERKMYRMPLLVETICKKLESSFQEEQIILLLDEIVSFGNNMGLDWSDLIPGPSTNLLLAFSPVSHLSGKELAIWERGISSKAKEYIRLPTDDSFEIVRLNQRYRNSRSIQEFSNFIGKDMKKYLALNEKPEIDLVGEKPIWMDVADKQAKIKPALDHMKKYVENDKKNEILLLYDKMLSKESKDMLEKLKEPRSKGGFGWKVMEERLFHGSECDTVFYVGSGHLEAFTRARLKLFIVTFFEDLDYSWYKQYQVSLARAAENGLIRKNVL